MRLFYISRRGKGLSRGVSLDSILKDRQLLVGGVLRCSPFLFMYSSCIHILYIK